MKTAIVTVATVAAIMMAGFWIVFDLEEATEPYEQNQMVNGCVMQKSSDQWIRTCG